MSAALHCPSCGHSLPSRARLGLAIHCERCQKVVTPQAQSFEPLIEPEMIGSRFAPDVDVPSGMTAFFSIFLIVGLMVLLCGGIGGYVAINSRKRNIAATEQLEQVNKQRQREFEAHQKARVRPQPIPPSPVRNATPPPVVPALPPPADPPAPPPVPTESPQPMAEPKRQPPRVPRPLPAGKSLDELLAELNDEQSKRPAWFVLYELARLPVQEDRKVDVSAALDRHLRSRDSLTLNVAAKVAIAWGTEWNGEALLALIDSPNVIARWDAMRALAKVRPTSETADLLLAQAHDVSNNAALRDAFKDLGPVGEQVMFACLESRDRQLKHSVLNLLGEVGSKSAIEPVETMLRQETDALLKGRAESVLKRIRSRHP